MELINLSYTRKNELRNYVKQLIDDASQAKNLIKLPKNVLETLIFDEYSQEYYPVWTYNLNFFDLSELNFDKVRYALPDLRRIDERIIDFSNTNIIIKDFGFHDIVNVNFLNVDLSKTKPVRWWRIYNCVCTNSGLRILDQKGGNTRFEFDNMLKKHNLVGCYFENVLIEESDTSLEDLREKNDIYLFEKTKNDIAKVLINK